MDKKNLEINEKIKFYENKVTELLIKIDRLRLKNLHSESVKRGLMLKPVKNSEN